MTAHSMPGAAVPVPTLREMPDACLANIRQAEREGEAAQARLDIARDRLRDWTEHQGRAAHDDIKRELKDAGQLRDAAVFDRPHWHLALQGWRRRLAAHPELADAPVGTRCEHGNWTWNQECPRRVREPGDDG